MPGKVLGICSSVLMSWFLATKGASNLWGALYKIACSKSTKFNAHGLVHLGVDVALY